MKQVLVKEIIAECTDSNCGYVPYDIHWVRNIISLGLAVPVVDPLEAIIDLHHDILFYLIFISTFALWMIGTIIFYFNSNEVLIMAVPNNQSYRLPALITYLKLVVVLIMTICFIALTMDYSYAHPENNINEPIEIVPECHDWRVKTFNEFRLKLFQFINVKHVNAAHAENLWTFLNVNVDHLRVFTSDPAHHQLLSFIHQYDKSFVGLKPLSHSSLHTAASELPHYPDLFKFTGKVPCKIAAENIPGGGDFAVLDKVEDIEAVYQAKTFWVTVKVQLVLAILLMVLVQWMV
jgi:hypothetical protein